MTAESEAMIRHAAANGRVLLASGDRAVLRCWTPKRSKVLFRRSWHTVPSGDVWPVCVCGDLVDRGCLKAGVRMCAGCRDRALDGADDQRSMNV